MLLLAEPRRIRRIRSLGHSLHRLAYPPIFRCGAFFFVALALADVPSARLTLSAAKPPRFRRGFAWLKPHFPAAKIFYDLRLDLRFVCYNGCELGDGH